MITISSAMQQDQIIELVNGIDKEGMTFTFKEKKGIKLFFDTTAEDMDVAVKLIKETIKATAWGAVLYYQVSAV